MLNVNSIWSQKNDKELLPSSTDPTPADWKCSEINTTVLETLFFVIPYPVQESCYVTAFMLYGVTSNPEMIWTMM